VFERFKHGIFADPLWPADHQTVVDLLRWALHAMSKPFDAMLSVVGVEELMDVLDPGPRLCRVAQFDTGWSIQIENRDAFSLDPTTVDDDTVFDEHRLTWAPSQLLDAAILIKPFGSGLVDKVAVLITLGSAA
jgi:hypothetical protein